MTASRRDVARFAILVLLGVGVLRFVLPFRPGRTRLLKSWGGETHEVLVTAENVIWKGKPYSSLSAVARAMTGTPRNGPKFFGLREDGQ